MDIKTRPLSAYLGGRGVLAHGISYVPPRLQSNCVNRILFYPGCFNPPHTGHLALLRHVLDRSGADLNIIAGVVFPLSDAALARKLGPDNDEIIFGKEERVRLWEGYGPAGDFWIFRHPDNDWELFRHNLLRRTARDGFEVRISLLCGPDHLQEMETLPIEPWGCKEIFFSDIGRDTLITSSGHMLLKQLDLYSPWKRCTVDCEAARKAAEAAASWMISGFFIIGPQSASTMLEKNPDMVNSAIEESYMERITSAACIWLCRRLDNPSCTIRFVPKSKDEELPRISSTAIRRGLKSFQTCRLNRKLNKDQSLSDVVLHPEILTEMLEETLYRE